MVASRSKQSLSNAMAVCGIQSKRFKSLPSRVKPRSVNDRSRRCHCLPCEKLSAGKSDKLSELIAACTIAPEGSRSEADFAVCCYAIRNGIAKDEVWTRLQSVGKFAEQGRRYST